MTPFLTQPINEVIRSQDAQKKAALIGRLYNCDMGAEEQMNVAELERLLDDACQCIDLGCAWSCPAPLAERLIRRVIAAENMADAIRENMPALHDHCWDEPQQELEGVLQAYEATK